MTAFYVVVEKLGDWQPYYPSQDVITFDEYLERVVAVRASACASLTCAAVIDTSIMVITVRCLLRRAITG